MTNTLKNGLVLSGGGARGAYEAGILYYLYVNGPKDLREQVHFEILSGTSIGALHITALAAGLNNVQDRVNQIVNLWKEMTVDQVLSLQLSDLFSISRWFLGKNKKEAFFSGERIESLLEGLVDWDQLHENLNQGLLEAITVSCTQVPTGKTVVFYETYDGRERTFSRDPHVIPVHARIGMKHAQASAAIPFVFPPVRIDQIPYSDGGLRQNTPLSPALRLGSNRLLVVGLGHERNLNYQEEEWNRRSNSPIFLLAKVVNALMLDRVDYDLIRLDHFNQLLSQGELVFGTSFVDKLNLVLSPLRQANYRNVPYLALRPSRDLGRIAADYLREYSVRTNQKLMAKLIKILSRLESPDEADLCSYLLFDGGFCEKLINLGMEDAHRQKEALLRFFDPRSTSDFFISHAQKST